MGAEGFRFWRLAFMVRLSQLQQAAAGVILEQFGVAHIAAKRIDTLVTAHVHHLENRRPFGGGRCEESAAQAVAAEVRSVEPDAAGTLLHDARDNAIGETIDAELAAFRDRAEYRAFGDASAIEPAAQRFDRAADRARCNRDRGWARERGVSRSEAIRVMILGAFKGRMTKR